MEANRDNLSEQDSASEMRPGALALYAFNYLKYSNKYSDSKNIYILNVGCGDGRDAVFLASNLPCHVLGVDSSERIISKAQSRLDKELTRRVEFLCYAYRKILDKFDVIISCNHYHNLRKQDRLEFRKTVKGCLNTEGTLFLSTLSINDPVYQRQISKQRDEQYIKEEGNYLHLSKGDDLEAEFSFLNISALFERECYENDKQKYLSWFLLGESR
jgi:2-polyprenyl-3-methyl-5-hydroxy-6-metoxy-1,4-benzoquinol methylase